MNKILVFFAAGCLGGLANSLTVWIFGNFDITSSLGVAISPSLNLNWLYPRIVWGGLWGLTFVLPVYKSNLFFKGTMLSLLPTIVQLFVVFPFQVHKGMAGLELGLYTPVFVFVL